MDAPRSFCSVDPDDAFVLIRRQEVKQKYRENPGLRLAVSERALSSSKVVEMYCEEVFDARK